jgi:hypothetical protein
MWLSRKVMLIKAEIEIMKELEDIEGLSWLRGRLESLKEVKPTKDDPINKKDISRGISFLIKEIDSIATRMNIESKEIFDPDSEYIYEGEL